MLKMNQIKLPVDIAANQLDTAIKNKISSRLRISVSDISDLEIVRRSLDARKKPQLFYIYTAIFSAKDEQKIFDKAQKDKSLKNDLSKYKKTIFEIPKANQEIDCRPIIVGTGPAGLFCGLVLAKAGFKPILLERGSDVDTRSADVEKFWKNGLLKPDSNVQFGEGGAGTFSDGKLNTLVKDIDGLNAVVLDTFVEFGAPENIKYDAKPHIGTDVLKDVVKNIRNEIISLGGEVRFNTCLTGIEVCENRIDTAIVKSMTGDDFATSKIDCSKLVLAIGHSSRDTLKWLYDMGLVMDAKPFAVGFRVQHPQNMIDQDQYGMPASKELGAAAYKVTAKTSSGRGVFSFCMCPGGYVVNASSEENMTAINGMSYSGRDGANANSAIIISVNPEDYPSDHPLSGIEFQRDLERKAFEAGKGAIPLQRYGSFRDGTSNDDYINSDLMPEVKGEYVWSDLRGIFTDEMNASFIEGMNHFGRCIKGFDREDTILAGVESRTSSPVRICRDDSYQSNISGVFPCGEGAGYAGGITSAAMDGIRVAKALINCYN